MASKVQVVSKKKEPQTLMEEFQHVFEDIKKGRIHPWKPRTISDTR